MRLLVTGGSGFIGSTFVRRVLAGEERSLLGAEAATVRWYAEYQDWWEPMKYVAAHP